MFGCEHTRISFFLLHLSGLQKSDPSRFALILGEVFREGREAQNLSQSRLADLSGVGRTGIIFFEKGERMPSIFFCKALANGLGTPLSELVKLAEERL